jgi:hypothetical protein
MVRTIADAEPSVETGGAPAATTNGIVARAAAGAQLKNAFCLTLTNPRGKRAYLWWEESGPVVAADDPAFRRRLLRAIKRPIVSVEDERDDAGIRWSTRKVIQPDDSLYPSRLFWSWIQVGLRDVKVEVVRRDSHERVWPPWDEATTT